MHHLAIMSLKGGAGRTTVAANLGRLLAERARTVVVDLDPQNTLGLAFGMSLGETRGVSDLEMGHAALSIYLRNRSAEIPFIPFGRTSIAHVVDLEETLRHDKTWLERRLRALAPNGYDFAVLDTPRHASPFQTQAVGLASALVVVLEACALSYATLPALEALTAEAQKRPGLRGVFYVLNRFDERRPLSRDIRDALANIVGDALIPQALPEDEHVREAIASRTTCVRAAPHAPFSAALREVASHMLEVLR